MGWLLTKGLLFDWSVLLESALMVVGSDPISGEDIRLMTRSLLLSETFSVSDVL